MKGQNFRLFANGGQRIVGALSCNVDFDVQTEDVSTKDSTGDWAQSEVTSKQANITAEAAVQLDANVSHREAVFSPHELHVGTRTVYPDGEFVSSETFNLRSFALHMGDIVQVNNPSQTILLIDDAGDILAELEEGDNSFEADADYNGCYLAALTSGTASEFFDIVDGGILFDAINEGARLSFAFHVATGDKNAEIAGEDAPISGYCVVTKRTLRSTNKQRAVWSLTAISDGEFN